MKLKLRAIFVTALAALTALPALGATHPVPTQVSMQDLRPSPESTSDVKSLDSHWRESDVSADQQLTAELLATTASLKRTKRRVEWGLRTAVVASMTSLGLIGLWAMTYGQAWDAQQALSKSPAPGSAFDRCAVVAGATIAFAAATMLVTDMIDLWGYYRVQKLARRLASQAE